MAKPIYLGSLSYGEVLFLTDKYEYTYHIDYAIAEVLRKRYRLRPGKFFNEIRKQARSFERRKLK